ncbi:hypothetical protein PPROV_001083200 [Pycnococcus provasolii]|uniref:Uncharacterized protein n=1 Tax=Pycnococcus provasolii TaxID=41880 RepID=A0A830HZR0_9CHLO|nr:hypothetical protein PPROV_001083200 [Pycnococcus provasolii]|mmetsp:Transcript_8066/g.18449  ORF Transcript_8066/g.18449 Transcript_8066/m.18449 type:complete len:256 (-) Transcript_8066:81-848(-)
MLASRPMPMNVCRARAGLSAPRRPVSRGGNGSQSLRRPASTIRAMASDDSGSGDGLNGYMKISNQIPPLVTATTVPIIAVSLLCKAITGSGLPGPLFGTVEGLSFLILPLGAGSLVPVLKEIAAVGDFSTDSVLRQLKGQGSTATENIEMLKNKTDSKSALGMQLADFAKVKAERAKESPEQKAEREKINAECAAEAKLVGKKVDAEDKAGMQSEDELKDQNVTETIAKSIAKENYDDDITKLNEKDLDERNLSA